MNFPKFTNHFGQKLFRDYNGLGCHKFIQGKGLKLFVLALGYDRFPDCFTFSSFKFYSLAVDVLLHVDLPQLF